MINIGIDIGKRTCVLDEEGNILDRTKYANKISEIEKFAKYAKRFGDCIAVCESTANMWIKTYQILTANGIPVVAANPLRMKLSQSSVKTDKIDTKKLASRLRNNDIPAVHVYDKKTRTQLEILRYKAKLVSIQVIYLSKQHSILDKYDYTLSCSGSSHVSGCIC